MSKKYQNEDRITFFEKIKRNISDFFYDIKVKIHQKRTAGKEAVVKIQASKNKGEIVFCISILVFPLIQWAFFFFALNGANILMAFKQYNITTKTFEYLPFNSCLKNFGNVLSDIFSGADGIDVMLLNALTISVIFTFLVQPLNWFTSYIIAKKLPGTTLMHIIFFMPSAISSLVLILVFRILLERALPAWGNMIGLKIPNLLEKSETNPYILPTCIGYMVFSALGGSKILMISQMARIPKDVFEYGRLEGINMWQEFKWIMIPNIWGLIVVSNMGFLHGWIGVSTPAFALYGEYAPKSIQTLQYFMYTKVIGARASEAYYGYTVAYDLMYGLIAVPSCLFGRWLLNKLDPGAEY